MQKSDICHRDSFYFHLLQVMEKKIVGSLTQEVWIMQTVSCIDTVFEESIGRSFPAYDRNYDTDNQEE